MTVTECSTRSGEEAPAREKAIICLRVQILGLCVITFPTVFWSRRRRTVFRVTAAGMLMFGNQ